MVMCVCVHMQHGVSLFVYCHALYTVHLFLRVMGLINSIMLLTAKLLSYPSYKSLFPIPLEKFPSVRKDYAKIINA